MISLNNFFHKHRKGRCMWLTQKEHVKDCFCSTNISYEHRDGACLLQANDKIKAFQHGSQLSLEKTQQSKAAADNHNDRNITKLM